MAARIRRGVWYALMLQIVCTQCALDEAVDALGYLERHDPVRYPAGRYFGPRYSLDRDGSRLAVILSGSIGVAELDRSSAHIITHYSVWTVATR
jgi:hypothetical protein